MAAAPLLHMALASSLLTANGAAAQQLVPAQLHQAGSSPPIGQETPTISRLTVPSHQSGHVSEHTNLKMDDSAAPSSPGQLELVWVSQDRARAGEAVMVVGWGSLFPNASVLCDGNALETIGHSSSAIMAALPLDLKDGRHDITLRAGSVQSAAVLGLGDAEVWWCQGDEGPNATQSGWVRCFGRAIGAVQSTPAPLDLRAEIALLAAAPTVSAQQLDDLMARHDTAVAAQKWSSPTLVLTPTAAGGHSPLRLVAAHGSVDGQSATFAVPAAAMPGEYSATLDNGAGGPASALNAFISPEQPAVRSVHIKPAKLPAAPKRFDITDYGPTGLNYTDPNRTVWAGHDRYFDAGGPPRRALAAAGAAAAAARSATPDGWAADQIVWLPAGLYHVQGRFEVPDGVFIAGASAGLTAIYFAYDTPATAPFAYFAPQHPGDSWGVSHLSVYVLSFYYNVFSVPAGGGRFRGHHLTIRADAFHNKYGAGGQGENGRAAAWPMVADTTCGGQGGYQPAVFRFGPGKNTTESGYPAIGPFGAAINVAVTDSDISGSWHLFQGKLEYGRLIRNTLYNGGWHLQLNCYESQHLLACFSLSADSWKIWVFQGRLFI